MSHKEPSWTNAACVVLDVVAVATPFVPDGAGKKVYIAGKSYVQGSKAAKAAREYKEKQVRLIKTAKVQESIVCPVRVQELPARIPQTYTSDLSVANGKGAEARNRAIDSIIKEDFKDLKLTYKPEYSPFIRTGIARDGAGTQIGKRMFSTRNDLRDTIVHEELHHRWWKRGIYGDHHPKGNDEKFYKVIDRYKQMRGWK